MKKLLVSLLIFMLILSTFSYSFAGTDPNLKEKKEAQLNALDKLQDKLDKKTDKIDIKWDIEKGVPRLVNGKLSDKPLKGKKDIEGFLKESKDLFKLDGDDFEVIKVTDDKLGMKHYKTQYTIDGIPVYGGEMIVHLDKNGYVYSVNGKAKPTIKTKSYSKDVELSEKEAIKAAEKTLDVELLPYVENNSLSTQLEEKAVDEPRYTIEPKAKLYLYEVKNTWKPVYIVELSFVNPYPAYWHIYVDAETGKIIKKNNEIRFDGATTGTGIGVAGDQKQLNTYLSGGTYYLYDTTKAMSGQIRTYTANYGSSIPGSYVTDSDNYFSSSEQRAGVDAHYYAGMVYDYYYDEHGRNSYDDNGASVVSSVHYGSDYNNAGWTGSQMIYGDGDGSLFGPFSGSLDVVAHELTHAVTEYSADLEYHNQPGALNESFSDVFGVIIEGDTSDWLVGEDCYTPGISGDGLRSMKNPELYDQPAHMDDYVNLPDTQSGDWGGVHTNSGIPNKAFYNIASEIGFNKSGDIYYRALTQYLTSTSDFEDARAALEQAAIDLYGSGSTEHEAVSDGFAEVGIGSSGGGSGDTFEPNDSFSQAYGSLASGNVYESYIYTSSDDDYYYVNMSSTGNLSISLTNLPGDYDLYLYNASGTRLARSWNGGTTSESISYNITSPGNYYIIVTGYNGAHSTSTPYKLEANY
ncbi:M4 family metallopeptidase [Sporosalibacterium faouarense]|uniref:M4 family metallopeptidase n=1 Tax=Sporosalibacterium faouarense TaxID=516123 RepID=UPI00141C0F09|nr:M4 family metallopeptidase [Sporosalibacterium faouarense]MTI49670.1 peptidase M4 family protein [Bacillota bacterium]